MYYNSIIETIGNTPLVRINKIATSIKATVLGKVEAYNPGHSVKDRMALQMIEQAEADGILTPGGTVVETTSGNTGYGIALICAVKGYKCVLAVPSKISDEKLNILKAVGADVIVCPTNVKADDPRSYYSVAKRISDETPNSFYVNQYFNINNLKAHYMTTGPEIWKQTEGKITHFVAGVGTGGTISGIGRYLKEQNPDVKIIGVDAYGSVLTKYHETGEFDEKEIYPYKIEGVGKNIIPSNVDFKTIDKFVKVTDHEAAFRARELARYEGLMVGYSCGAAMQGVFEIADTLTENDLVVVLFPDHGSRYLGKIYNDEWMKEMGFMDKKEEVITS